MTRRDSDIAGRRLAQQQLLTPTVAAHAFGDFLELPVELRRGRS